MKTLAPFCLVLGLCVPGMSAQSQGTRSAGSLSAVAPGHELALRLARLLHQDIEKVLAPMTDAGGSQDATTAQALRRIMSAHIAKYAPPDTILAITARLYEHAFSEADLRGMVEFFTSPLGERYLRTQSALLPSVQQEVNTLLMPHQAELVQKLTAATHPPGAP
jgi:hypothetical protein